QGLQFLAREQQDDGSWIDKVGRKVYNSYDGRIAKHVGVTALAGIAFLSSGATPGGGPGVYKSRTGRDIHGHEIVEKALSYVISRTSPTGFITDNGSRMYSHAFAALFLAEAYGMGYDQGGRLQDALRRSIRMIETSQNPDGGWRYRPQAIDADMSITVCQVMALRAARNAGVGVSKEVIDKAVQYVRRSFLPGVGAFMYQIGSDFRSVPSRYSFALTAAGVTTLYGAGEYNAVRIINPAIRYLWVNRPHVSEARDHFDYYYGQYYAVQALFQKGGEDWRRWYEDYIKPDLLKLQESDGSWNDLVGSRYATAMATIILQFPNQYLPITEN
ncbi:MAG TPA: prenyltransferase/squalene oxidase repeat-containing protein, partial [Planctomycetota bacterium]|nr:prenyltransferase/squalene oxidase repeat-containing protein [Planctomycetota bacterium]